MMTNSTYKEIETNEKFNYRFYCLMGPDCQDITRQMDYSKFKERLMLILRNAYRNVLFLFLFIYAPSCIYSDNCSQSFDQCFPQNVIEENDFDARTEKGKKHKHLFYYMNISDFVNSFIEIPTSNVSGDSTTISSTYLAGRAPVYDRHDVIVGTCSASFLCMQNEDGIYTDISNHLSVDNGLILSWATPTTLANLELDSIVESMVTETIVVASTKIGSNPYYGKTFNMIVSSDDVKIYFKLFRK